MNIERLKWDMFQVVEINAASIKNHQISINTTILMLIKNFCIKDRINWDESENDKEEVFKDLKETVMSNIFKI